MQFYKKKKTTKANHEIIRIIEEYKIYFFPLCLENKLQRNINGESPPTPCGENTIFEYTNLHYLIVLQSPLATIWGIRPHLILATAKLHLRYTAAPGGSVT